ncbi:hypothetical protein CSB67_5247 (plasmid) [Enterobacter hormaechei]|nr:hypothetical protein CSB67_5247 [Enterobacter hormaechei]
MAAYYYSGDIHDRKNKQGNIQVSDCTGDYPSRHHYSE